MSKAIIDLHLHLDGAITPAIAKQLAALQGITLPARDDEELASLLTVPADCTDLNDFLKCFALPGELMQTKAGLQEAAHLVSEDLYAQGLRYAELRFAPQLHTKKGMTQEEAIQAVLLGIEQSPLKANVILCLMRDDNNEATNEETLTLARKYVVEDGGVVAIDLAGAEALYPAALYKDLFCRAKDYGIPFTFHAGEAAGAENVRLALEYGARRIGHGVRSYEDAELLSELVEKQIPLEMCPTSNRQTHAVEDMTQYPLMDYLAQGIKVTLNTDDPAIEGTTLEAEFHYMKENYGLTAEQEKILLRNAIDSAFTNQKVKEELRKIADL